MTASYNPGNNSVTVLLGPTKAGTATQLMMTGLYGGNEQPLATSVIEL